MIASILLAAIVANLLTRRVIPRLRKQGVVDTPNERSSHTSATVRGAGLAVALAWTTVALIIVALQSDRRPAWFGVLGLAAGLSLVGFWDDLVGVKPIVRLCAQALLAASAVGVGVRTDTVDLPGVGAASLGRAAVPLCVLAIIAMVNLFNFMDGIDGLAIGQTMVAALVLMGGALIVQATTPALLAGALAGVAGGFLPLNWSPAKCFMGDSGSYFCGGALAGLLILGQNTGVPALLVGLASTIFLADAIVTLVLRALNGKPVWKPHRSHFYQRLVQAGWSHSRVSATYMTIGVAVGAAALFYLARLRYNLLSSLP